MSKETLKYIARGVISVVLLAAVLMHVDLAAFKDVFVEVHFSWVWVIVLSLALDRVIAARKLQLVLALQKVVISVWRLVQIMLVGMFWGFFVPSSVGIDLMIGYQLYREVPKGADIASAIIVDRMMGMLTLMLLGIAGVLLLADQTLPFHKIGLILMAITVAMIAVMYAFLHERSAQWLERRFGDSGRRIVDGLLKIYRILRGFSRYRGTLGLSFGLSLVLQVVRVLEVYSLARFLGVDVPFLFLFVVIAIATALVIVPVSIGGLGLREGTYASLFAMEGYPAAEGLAVSIGVGALDLSMVLLGGLLSLWLRPPRPIENSDSST